VTRALKELVEIAERMAEALVSGDLPRVAELLSANWVRQRRLDSGMQTAEMARLEAAMAAAGALGGKAAGAGAGGSMFFIMGDDPAAGRQAAMSAGATILEAGWSAVGVERC
jgi:D-glycero-alpha-D-manno-heptose-7-phosphate kinase